MKRWISLLLTAVLLLTLVGCGSDDFDFSDFVEETPEYTTHSRVTIPSMPSYSYESPTTTKRTTVTRYTYPTYTSPTRYTYPSYTTRPTTTTRYTTSTTKPVVSHPKFSSLVALRDYMTAQIESDILKFTFDYTGEQLSARLIAQMTSSCCVSLNQNGTVYTVTIYEYPGDRIVDAYRSGDSSKLNSAERTAMNKALQLVKEAKAKASGTFELEVLLHDVLCDMITYDDHTRDVPDPYNPPRNLTVVGALLDGRANCQGYADAFYTLASIAGFKVSRMYTYTPNDLHVVNTVYLNNAWYVVDVTFDDTNDDERNYRLFNAGADVIREYAWHPEMEMHPIAKTSGVAYYYNYTNSTYTSMQTMANAIAAAWSKNGSTVIRTMLKNNTDGNALNAMLKSALDKTGKRYSYQYRYYQNGRDTFYTVKFN